MPAVTASIKALEAELGQKLFDRHSNGVTLTFDGQQFLQRAHTIEASISDAVRGPHRWGTQVDGTVDVAVSYTVAGYFLPPLLSRFWRAFPGITVRLHEFARQRRCRRHARFQFARPWFDPLAPVAAIATPAVDLRQSPASA